MGYGYYTVSDFASMYGTRPGGYMVLATCDKRGCDTEIDRGLGYICGDSPHGFYDAAPGCGRYYCEEHGSWVGPRGGCDHRGRRAWGRTLACMELSADGSVVCCNRVGHMGPHWADE